MTEKKGLSVVETAPASNGVKSEDIEEIQKECWGLMSKRILKKKERVKYQKLVAMFGGTPLSIRIEMGFLGETLTGIEIKLNQICAHPKKAAILQVLLCRNAGGEHALCQIHDEIVVSVAKLGNFDNTKWIDRIADATPDIIDEVLRNLTHVDYEPAKDFFGRIIDERGFVTGFYRSNAPKGRKEGFEIIRE